MTILAFRARLRLYYLLGALLLIVGAISALVVNTIPNTAAAALTIGALMVGFGLMAYVIGRLAPR